MTAKRRNACEAAVIGAGRHAPHPDAPIHRIAEKLILGAEDLPAEVRASTGGKGADVVFDLVGGVMFRNAVNSLALRGRLVEIAATGGREVSFDLADFYHNESRLYGVDTLKRDLTASAEVLEALTAGFVAGDYRAAPIRETCGLGEGQEAYRKVAAGSAGRSSCGRRNRGRWRCLGISSLSSWGWRWAPRTALSRSARRRRR